MVLLKFLRRKVGGVRRLRRLRGLRGLRGQRLGLRPGDREEEGPGPPPIRGGGGIAAAGAAPGADQLVGLTPTNE